MRRRSGYTWVDYKPNAQIAKELKITQVLDTGRTTWQLNAGRQLDLKTREINRLIGKHSPLSLENKLLIYKTVLKPVLKYGI